MALFKLKRKFVLLTLGLMIISLAFAQNRVATVRNYNSLLWKVSGKGLKKPSYIYGTFHIMCKKDIIFTESVLPAIKSADEVYFEMNLDDMSNTLGALMFLNMKEGKSLKDFYTEAEYKRVSKFMKDTIGMPLAFLEKMKPMLIESLFYTKYLDCEKSSGVEMELMNLVKKEKKPIKGFETVKDQGAVFDSIPYKLQAEALLKSIDKFTETKKDFYKMYNLYKAQNLSALAPMMEDDSLFTKYTYLLLDKRNMNWIEQMKKIIPQKTLFIAVGAGHLLGKKGLLTLLAKEGYRIESVKK